MKITTIQLHVNTIERLKQLKLVPMESYENVINRALDENERLTAELERMKQ